ncbi:S24 family peptidase [Photobacterium damselae]|uniref:S24 family peptidase n=1 Tax=Photobacterium damselae TaxID=38293 RepID=UPI001EFDFE5C|nr:LexA family transcriptional regulator [Photobacterium damselae]MCG9780692.1 helix-turn-helix domain-containing protein [Photobacterium damselae]
MKELGGIVKDLRLEAGLSQQELAEHVGVTKSTISQWERGVFYPKHKYINLLAKFFNKPTSGIIGVNNKIIDKECECEEVTKIPFYNSINAAAGNGYQNDANDSYDYEFIRLKDLPYRKSYESFFCINVVGDSMEPVLKNGSLIVVDSSNKDIVDGSMYVFVQDDFIRVKIFSYEKQQIKVSSYNSRYKDEYYRFDEISNLYIVGKVVFYATKID